MKQYRKIRLNIMRLFAFLDSVLKKILIAQIWYSFQSVFFIYLSCSIFENHYFIHNVVIPKFDKCRHMKLLDTMV